MKTLTFTLLVLIGVNGNLFSQWRPLATFPQNIPVRCLTYSGSSLFVGTEGHGFYRSIDNGVSWDSSLAGMDVKCIAVLGNNVFAGTLGNGVRISKNNGQSWTGTGLNGAQIISLFVKGTNVYAGKWDFQGVFMSADTGVNWTQTSLQQEVNTFVEAGGAIYAGTRNNYVFKSTDNFSSWTQVDNNLTNPKIRELAVSGNFIYAATDGGGIFRTSDGGANWTAVNSGLFIPYIMTLEVVGTSVFAGTGTVFRTLNDGAVWKEANHCMPYALEVNTLILVGSDLYAGTENGIWKVNVNAVQEKVEVCMVTVDDQNKNEVVWQKPVSTALDSFYIYRESSVTDVYTIIGRLSHTALSSFTDTASRPEVQSNKYKVSYNTNCGLPLVTSSFHKTMHLSIVKGMGDTWNLIWDPYTGFTVSTYNIYRGTSASNLQLLSSVSGGNTQYTDVNPPAGFVYYRVEVVKPDACESTKTYNSSLSNIASNNLTSLTENTRRLLCMEVYPNPAMEQARVFLSLAEPGELNMMLTDITGKKVKQWPSAFFIAGQYEFFLPVAQLPSGLYWLTLRHTAGGTSTRMLVVR